jgi:hypothetical protein
MGLAELTNRGYVHHKQLGQRLRQRYVHDHQLVSPDYLAKEVSKLFFCLISFIQFI